MFCDYIYLDIDRIKAYGAKIGIKKEITSQVTERTEKNIGAEANVKFIKGGASGKQETVKEYENLETDEAYFEEFEKRLSKYKNDGYFINIADDYEEFNGYEKINKQSIVKFEAKLLIPEEFGEVEFIKKILDNPYGKNALFSSINNNENDEILNEFLNTLIKDNGNIPVYFEMEDYKLYSSIKGKYFSNIEYLDFEENVGEYLTVVAKVEKIDCSNKEIVLYDIYKELLNFNRAMRRSIGESNQNDIPEKIKIYGKSIKLSILAMYK